MIFYKKKEKLSGLGNNCVLKAFCHKVSDEIE